MKINYKKGISLMLAGMILVSLSGCKVKEEKVSETVFNQQFVNPTSDVRPKTRWWIPGSHMTKDEIEKEIKSMAEAGFGGAEVVPVAPGGVDGEEIDWGSEEWNEMIKFMLQTAGKYDFLIDFTLTPSWPLAIPTITNVDDLNQGAQMEVDGGNMNITKEYVVDEKEGGLEYRIKVPVAKELDEGTPVLVAVTLAKYADKESKTLDYSSARTLTIGEEVVQNNNNPIDYTADFVLPDDGEYVLFGWWQHPSANKTYGKYQIDHYGKAGSQAIIDYWENTLLPYYGDDFNNVTALFADSLEYQTHLDWTQGLLNQFKDYKGYDFTAYLPAVYEQQCRGDYFSEPNPDFKFNNNNIALMNDFKDVLTRLYIDNHLKPLKEFANKHGVALRYQTAYGKNLELPQTAGKIDIPESETLYGNDIIDFYRLQSGAVNMTGQNIYSLEAAAEFLVKNKVTLENGTDYEYELSRGNGENDAGNYQQTWADMLWHVQRAFSGGVNQVVFHGNSYGGQYEGAGSENGYLSEVKWPGFEGFGIRNFSNNWNERQPNWKHAKDYTDYIARNQLVLRQGRASVDVAVYAHRYWEQIDYNNPMERYQDNQLLENSGYTYDFLAPSSFNLENAKVENNRLDINGPGYKAIILDNQETIPVETADRFIEYAKVGLPIIIVGDAPSEEAYQEGADIKARMTQLMAEPSVKQVASTQDVPNALKESGVSPDVSYKEPSALLNVHRQTDDSDFYYFYNYGNANNYPDSKNIPAVNTQITVKAKGTPYLLNCWSGEITPIAKYTKVGDQITLDATIGGNDSMVVMVTSLESPVVDRHAVETNLKAEYDTGGSLIAKGFTAGTETVTLDNGKNVKVKIPEIPQAITLSNWNLSIESWTKGSTPTDVKKTVVFKDKLDKLVPWNQLPGLELISGIGTYTCTFNMDKGWDEGIGAILNLGEVAGTYRISINGSNLKTDQIDTSIDIGTYLKKGENEVTIEVASTLLNAIIAEYPDDGRSSDEYGLLAEVVISPYTWKKVVPNR